MTIARSCRPPTLELCRRSEGRWWIAQHSARAARIVRPRPPLSVTVSGFPLGTSLFIGLRVVNGSMGVSRGEQLSACPLGRAARKSKRPDLTFAGVSGR